MKYRVDFKPSAARQLRKLPKDIAERISKKIDFLADNPFPHGYTEMKGSKDFYRIKAGDYRNYLHGRTRRTSYFSRQHRTSPRNLSLKFDL